VPGPTGPPGVEWDGHRSAREDVAFVRECQYLLIESATLIARKVKIGAWKRYYNENRPHSSLQWDTPAEFARRCWPRPTSTTAQKPEISVSGCY